MYNPNSPIINNMMYGGMQSNGCIPSMPIGNIGLNMGQGYNGGFYNGVYNNYYNPYLQAQIQKQQQEEYRRSLLNQSNVMMQMSRTAHAVTGTPVDENMLRQRYQPQQIQQQSEADMNFAQIQRRQFEPPSSISRGAAIINEVNKFKKENEKYVREDMSFEEFCKNSGELLYNINVQESIAQQRDLSKLYNKNDYSKLIHGGGYNNNLFRPEVTLDDMSVFPSLGEKMKKEYAIRRQQFMDAILNK